MKSLANIGISKMATAYIMLGGLIDEDNENRETYIICR